MVSLNKATKPEDINPAEIAKTLADIKSMQKYVRDLVMLGVKMSTFGVLQMETYGDDAKPIAFTITKAQRDTLLAETRELSKKNARATYVDVCAENSPHDVDPAIAHSRLKGALLTEIRQHTR